MMQSPISETLAASTAKITGVLCILLSLFHVYTAGFGLLNEVIHRTVHLTFVLGLVFLVFPRRKPGNPVHDWGFGTCFAVFYLFLAWQLINRLGGDLSPLAQGGITLMIGFIALTALPIRQFKGEGDDLSFADWPLAIAAAGISLYLIVFFKQIFITNIGFPQIEEYVMGLLAIIMVTEACRRVMGNTLPVIGAIAMVYGLLGPWLPGVLGPPGLRYCAHCGTSLSGYRRYLMGVAVGVVWPPMYFILYSLVLWPRHRVLGSCSLILP